MSSEITIALAGNPNVGKSTVFNELTGMHQHTGNWTGKTVISAKGKYMYNDNIYTIIDLPGTYSLVSNSEEEQVARDFICYTKPDLTVVICDATCLQRNLNLVYQVLEITDNAIVCVNLADHAIKKGITIDEEMLEKLLGVPVVMTSAKTGQGLEYLKVRIETAVKMKSSGEDIKHINYDNVLESCIEKIEKIIIKYNNLSPKITRWCAIRVLCDDCIVKRDVFNDKLTLQDEEVLEECKKIIKLSFEKNKSVEDIITYKTVKISAETAKQVIKYKNKDIHKTDRKVDKLFTSKWFGIPIMLLLLCVVFWITITGANYPSAMLSNLFEYGEEKLSYLFTFMNSPSWLHGILVLGIYRTVGWVISVMLPPMAIFFPLFTLLEDLGYLPRVAFNMDSMFKKAGCCGKQALTMCMGFGCNAAGIVGCRIINSKRERLLAIITNTFVPCNGRFPTIIAIITMFFAITVAKPYQSIFATVILVGVIVFSVLITLLVSKILTKTLLKGESSAFTLEMPPYRKPKILTVIVRSIFDRTLHLLARAIVISIPAGAIIWILANVYIGNVTILNHLIQFFDPFARFIGLDGVILMAFILGFPANEIVIPIIIMSYMATGYMLELDSLTALRELLVSNGWTWVTALCTMLFSLIHYPCGTTLLTIKKETGSAKWTALSFVIPTLCGIIICAVVNNMITLLIK